jgi:hypothetical protein
MAKQKMIKKKLDLYERTYRQSQAPFKRILAANIGKVVNVEETKILEVLYRLNPMVNYIHNIDYCTLTSIGDLERVIAELSEEDRYEI